MNNIQLRPYREADFEEILALFFNTVHTVNKADYTPAQLDAWAPAKPNLLRWRQILSQETIIADEGSRIAAFAVWDGLDYLDCLFVRHDRQRRGLASALCNTIETEASRRRSSIIRADVSLTAQPFFHRRGYVGRSKQYIRRAGQMLINVPMRKKLYL